MTQDTSVPLGRVMTQNEQRILAEFRDFLRSWSAAERTVSARLACVTARIQDWGLDGFTAANVRDYFATTSKLRSKWSRATYHQHLNSFGEFLVTAGYADSNPMEQVRKAVPPKSEPRPLSEAQVQQVLEVAHGEVRDWILLALLAGLRVHEIAKIRGEDVDIDGLWVEGKGDKRVTLPLHPDLWDMAQRYPKFGYWFAGPVDGHIRSNSISTRVGRLFRPLGISGSIHRCRHSYATRLLRQGTNVRQVQKLMRHGSLQTTAAYTAVDEDELRNAINRLPRIA